MMNHQNAATESVAAEGRVGGKSAPALHIASSQYPWITFCRRDGREFVLAEAIAGIAASGLPGLEPMISAPAQVLEVAPLLRQHGLEMRSLYLGATLHTPQQVERSIAGVLDAAAAAQPLGAHLVVVNPTPLGRGAPEDKDEAQLATQAAALQRLACELAALGMALSYHFHAAEMRQGGRELHRMLADTDPQSVGLCLDAHWVYRGAGNSTRALEAIVERYGTRINSVHLRQSQGGTWCEAFGPGDIDYPALARALAALGLRPHLVLEQAVEAGTPRLLSAVEAHRHGLAYARSVFEGAC